MKHLALAVLLLAACGKSDKKDPPATAHDAAAKPVAIDAAAAQPAEGPYTMTVTPAAAIAEGKPAKLTIELQAADGARVTQLDVVHEKVLHLIVVSNGLAQFDHIHPEPQPDGTLVVDATFPAAGTYFLYGDFKPAGGKQAVARATVDVPGAAKPDPALAPAALPQTGKAAGYEVTLRADAPLAVGETVLKFAIAKDGKAVADLQPYLGARGHCVMISSDGERYLHSHPLSDATPDVEFHTELPAAGTYKIWAEFRPNGDPLRVSFVVEVKDAGAATPDAPDAGMHDHEHPVAIDAGAAKPRPDAAPAAEAAPDAAPPKADDTKLAAAETAAWGKAKSVFVEHCAECHTKDGAKPSARKLAKFDMSSYPFAGKDADAAHMRKVLGIGGGKATMPKGKVGSVSDDELALIAAWADAYDAAHAQ